MRQLHRLGALQVCVAGNVDVHIGLAKLHQGQLQVVDLVGQLTDFLAQPHTRIERHLIVARPACVQFGSGRHALGQSGLDVHVHIFQLRPPFKLALGNLAPDGFQPVHNRLHLAFFQQTHVMQHTGMGDRAGDIVMRQPCIKLHRIGERIGLGRRSTRKTSAACGD